MKIRKRCLLELKELELEWIRLSFMCLFCLGIEMCCYKLLKKKKEKKKNNKTIMTTIVLIIIAIIINSSSMIGNSGDGINGLLLFLVCLWRHWYLLLFVRRFWCDRQAVEDLLLLLVMANDGDMILVGATWYQRLLMVDRFGNLGFLIFNFCYI